MSDFKMKFGAQIRKLRKRIGLTQEQLGERLDTSRTTIRNYEKGTYGPEFERIPEIAKALEVSKSELFDF